jgi:hypothetical protein
MYRHNLLENKMALYLTFLNLITGTPGFIDRLTTGLRRDRNRSRPILLSQSGQAPPHRSVVRRLRPDLWRYRIQSIRPTDLSPHLRRDIGLDS